jgi:sugar lactone lactonase YvrE
VKRKLSPVTTALAIILVLAAVLFAYSRGLLGARKRGAGQMKGGGPMAMEALPATGLPTVNVETLAGYTRPGYKDAQGWDAQFSGPAGIAAAPDGSLFVSDSRNHRLRRIAPDGTVTTVAGSGPTDSALGAFADGPADRARLFNPTGLAVGSDGALYVADAGNHRIRRLQDGVVTTIAGSATPKDDLGFEQGGYRDGPAVTAQFRFPGAVALDGKGAVLVADLGNGKVRRIGPDAVVSTVAPKGPTPGPTGLVWLGGALLCVDPASGLVGWPGGPVPDLPRPTAACALGPQALAVVSAEWHGVFAVPPNGPRVLLAGILPTQPEPGFRDDTGNDARFCTPCAVTSIGYRLFVADFGNNCIRALTVPADWASPQPPPFPPFGQRRRGGSTAD